jgi:hypothetical protein
VQRRRCSHVVKDDSAIFILLELHKITLTLNIPVAAEARILVSVWLNDTHFIVSTEVGQDSVSEGCEAGRSISYM